MTETAEAHDAALARLPEPALLESCFGLPGGSFDPVGIKFEGIEMTYEDWEGLGHVLGEVSRWNPFAVGDWMLAGEQMFAEGDQWAQAIEGTPGERYDIGSRVTGLNPNTIENYASVCRRVSLTIRRAELKFGHHDAVKALDEEDQVKWLQEAVDNGWQRDELRQAIREAKAPDAPENEEEEEAAPRLSELDRYREVVALALIQGEPTSDGGLLIPSEIHAQMRAVHESD